MHRIHLLVLVLLATTIDIAYAQRYGPVMRGEKIRLRYCGVAEQPERHDSPNCGSAEGTVLEADADTVVISQRTGDALTVPFAWVTKLEVSHGYRSRVLAGVAIGAGLAAVAIADPDICYHPDDTAACSLFAVAAMGTGALVGLILSGEKWEEVSLDLLQVRVAAQRERRLGVGLLLRF